MRTRTICFATLRVQQSHSATTAACFDLHSWSSGYLKRDDFLLFCGIVIVLRFWRCWCPLSAAVPCINVFLVIDTLSSHPVAVRYLTVSCDSAWWRAVGTALCCWHCTVLDFQRVFSWDCVLFSVLCDYCVDSHVFDDGVFVVWCWFSLLRLQMCNFFCAMCVLCVQQSGTHKHAECCWEQTATALGRGQ